MLTRKCPSCGARLMYRLSTLAADGRERVGCCLCQTHFSVPYEEVDFEDMAACLAAADASVCQSRAEADKRDADRWGRVQVSANLVNHPKLRDVLAAPKR